MSLASSEQLVGAQVGRYRLERILGEGGMGCVYLGVHDGGKRVAIKVLSKQTDDSMQRFRAEAHAVSLISHFNIVNLIDVAELPDGRPYMVMELVEGKSLRDVAPTATAETIARLCIEVLAALEAAHAIGIVHRDLKPDNIMVTRTGHAKVLDFGVAKLAPGVGGGNTPRTAEGLTMGTPAYMAPEQVIGGSVDARTDVYTMGVVLFEVLTGRRPFTGATDVEVMRAHRDRAPPRPRTVTPDIPVAIEDVILRALAKDPARRFQSAREMASALDEALAGRSSRSLVTDDSAPTRHERPLPRPARSHLPAMIAVAIIAIAATVVFMVARSRKQSHAVRAQDDAVIAVDDDAGVADAPVVAVDAAIALPVDAASADARAPASDAAVAVRPPAKPSSALPEPIARAPDFSTDAFEPLAYVAKATELAKRLAPDAQLYEITGGPVNTAGVIDLSRTQRRMEYRYISATNATAAPIDGERPCVVVVDVSPAGARARVAMDKRCTMKPVAAPRCTLRRLRDLAYTGVMTDFADADLTFVYRGRWQIIKLPTQEDSKPARLEVPDC